mgnify:CR=1 FL=1
MITYAKLWVLLEKKGLKKKDLLNVISAPTLAKLGKNENVNVKIISEICEFLDCQPGDIMEYVSDKQIQKVVEQLGTLQQMTVNTFKEIGMNEEQIRGLMNEALTKYIDGMFSGKNPFEDYMQQAMKTQNDIEEGE